MKLEIFLVSWAYRFFLLCFFEPFVFCMNQKKQLKKPGKNYQQSSKHHLPPSRECQADRLVDFVLEQILGYLEQMGRGRLMDGHGSSSRESHSGDSVNQLETMPSKVEARHTEGWIMLDLTIQYP